MIWELAIGDPPQPPCFGYECLEGRDSGEGTSQGGRQFSIGHIEPQVLGERHPEGHIKEANGHRDLDLSRKTCGHLATEAWGVAEPSQGKKDWGLGNPDLQDRSQDRGSSQRGEQVRAWERGSPGREL